jgi:AcrR family transcriptional regulator
MGSAENRVAPRDAGTGLGSTLQHGHIKTTDKRLLRGARTRELVLRHAVDLASLDGLDNVTFGRLATEVGLSKAGIQTLFKAKEALQLATVRYARRMFIDAVIRPARSMPPGVARLRALVDHWAEYATAPLFTGGCFRAANLADFDSRPGPVRDELYHDQQEWTETLAGELRHAVATGEIGELDVDLAAFQIDAVLCAANTALRMGDDDAINKVYRVVEGMLMPPRR